MKTEEIVKQAKAHFGKNRRRLKTKLLAYRFDGKNYLEWKSRLKNLTLQPFDVSYGIFDDVVDSLTEKNYSEIDWHWLGDLSWKFKILLNNDVGKGFEWDKKLALKCGGTARILQIYLSDVIPCFVVDVYYMTYNKTENYYEFGPIQNLSNEERETIGKIKTFFLSEGFTFLSEKDATKNYKELCSDCNSDGNATLFDVLFSDTDGYQQEIKRFNDKNLKNATGKKTNWNEYYDVTNQLIKREEYIYYASKNVVCITTDKSAQITEVKVWRDIENSKHREFILDISKEYEKKKRKETRVKN